MKLTRISKLIAVVALSALVVACGRKGPLETPSASASASGQAQADGAPADDKPFVLDPLL